ncbi:MAG TPA: MOP flippase family protein [Ramlibacter sp.]
MNLRGPTLHGIRWTAVENVLNVLFGIATLAILARLLQPQHFGLMAVVAVIVGLSMVFADLGISNAVIHRQDVDEAQLSTLYWLNVLGGVAIYLVLLALAVPLARFYGEPELVPLVAIAGLATVVQSLGQQYNVLLRKELHFGLLARIGIASRFLALVSAVGLALADFGVYALVGSSLAGTCLATVLTVAAGWRLHRPRLQFQPARVRHFLGFGAYQVGEGSIAYLTANLDSLLIGRLAGAEALGLYSVAKQFVTYPAQVVNPVVTRVAMPVMARLQDDIPRLRAMYLQAIGHLSSLNFPIYAAIAVFAAEITALLFGPRWEAAVPLMRILAIHAALRSVGTPVGSLILARGRARLAFWWNASLVFLTAAAMLAGAMYGPAGVAWALLLLQVALQVPNWRLLVRPLCGAGWGEYAAAILRPAAAAAMGALAGGAVALAFPGDLTRLAAGLAVSALVTLLAYLAWNRGFLDALRAVVLARNA